MPLRPLYFQPGGTTSSLKEAAFVPGCIFPSAEEPCNRQQFSHPEFEHLGSLGWDTQKLLYGRKERMLRVSKTLQINANMEDQDAGVVDPGLQCGVPQHSQNPLGLVEWLVGHSVPLPC